MIRRRRPTRSATRPTLTSLTGSDVDLTKAVFACEGLKIEVTPGAWSGLMPAVVSGQIDVMPYLYFNPKRAQQVDFVLYQKAGTGALVAKGNPTKIKSNDDLCGKRVATLQASVEEALAHEVAADLHEGRTRAGVEIMTYSGRRGRVPPASERPDRRGAQRSRLHRRDGQEAAGGVRARLSRSSAACRSALPARRATTP